MIPIRRFVGIAAYMALPVILMTLGNYLVGSISDFGANLYLTGLATAALSLLVHLIVVRRIFPRDSPVNQILGIAISVILSFNIYSLLYDYTAHITYLQRQGSSVSWGDEGALSGLPSAALGFAYGPTFSDRLARLPGVVVIAAVTAIVWLPCFYFLERWSYAPPQEPSANDK